MTCKGIIYPSTFLLHYMFPNEKFYLKITCTVYTVQLIFLFAYLMNTISIMNNRPIFTKKKTLINT